MKIFDIVFFYNEHQLLNRRVEYLKKMVNHTIVLNFGGNHIENDFVTVIPVMEHFDDFKKKDFVKMIINFIGNKNISYEDKFIFSKTFEVPSIDVINKFILDTSEGPKIIEHETFIHSVYKKSIYSYFGCALSSYGDLIQKKNIEEFLFEKHDFVYNREKFLNGGYCLLNFEKTEESLKSLKYWFPEYTNDLCEKSLEYYRNKNLNIFSHEKPHVLSDSKNKDLKYFDIPNLYEQTNSKILITFFYDNNDPTEYDNIIYITENNIKIDGISTWIVNKPKKIFYKSKHYFEDYKKNDILRCLRALTLNDNDDIHVKTKTTGSPVVFKYGFLKNSIPSELI